VPPDDDRAADGRRAPSRRQTGLTDEEREFLRDAMEEREQHEKRAADRRKLAQTMGAGIVVGVAANGIPDWAKSAWRGAIQWLASLTR
jgi:hypothetical protein